MNKLVEKLSEQLPKSPEAIAKRERARKAAATAVISLSMLGATGGVIHLGLNAAEHQAEITQNTNDENVYKQSTLDRGNQSIDHSVELPTLPSPENS